MRNTPSVSVRCNTLRHFARRQRSKGDNVLAALGPSRGLFDKSATRSPTHAVAPYNSSANNRHHVNPGRDRYRPELARRPTTERLEPGVSHIDVSLRSLTWPHIP
jgi:hypothetical protein